MRRHVPLVLLLALAAAGCSTTIRARVLDAETREPIQGAVVVGVWTKVVGPLLYHHEDVGILETDTDAEGRFQLERLPSSGLNGEGGGQAITVYKFGYVAWSNLFLFPTFRLRQDQRIPPEILLARFPPGEKHRRHLDFISAATRATLGFSNPETPKFRDALKPELDLDRRESQR